MTLKSTKIPAKPVLKATSPINTQKASAPAKIDAIRRHNQIAKAAYYLAEKEKFNGNSVNHWLQAEASIDEKLTVK